MSFTKLSRNENGRSGLTVLIFTVAMVVVASFIPNYLPRSLTSELPDEHEPYVYTKSHFVALVSEVGRVQRLEDQLKLKASQIEAVIQDAAQLDFDAHHNIDVEANATLGIGGGDLPRSPMITFNLRGDRQITLERDLISRLNNQIDALKAVPVGYPVAGEISSGFGMRVLGRSRRAEMHSGVDLAVEKSTPVLSAADGVIIHAGYKGGYGLMVLVDHGSGFETLYGHLGKTSVKVGERVCRGERIGYVGMTGRTTGPHLHYEVRLNGEPKDPVYFLDLAGYLKVL